MYADALGRRLRVFPAAEACDLGAAVCAAAAAAGGGGAALLAAQGRAVSAALAAGGGERVYEPAGAGRGREAYEELYALYREMHDAFGGVDGSGLGGVGSVMKRLIAIREAALAGAGGGGRS